MRSIIVCGYGCSGSGIVIDYLKGFSGVFEVGFEFSLIKEPDGLDDLSHFLLEDWDPIKSDYAINRFLKFCNVLNRKNNKFGKWGLSLGERLKLDFNKITDQYLKNLTDYKYQGSSRVHLYAYSTLHSFFKKIHRKIDPIGGKGKEMFFSKPSKKNFYKFSQEYIENLFKPLMEENNCEVLLLDQAISVNNLEKSLNFFKNTKVIIVERDPRDILSDLILNKLLIGSNKSVDFVENYITWHKGLRHNKKLKFLKNVMFVQFEEFINDFNKTTKKINSFLEIDPSQQIKNKYLDLEKSRSNIGLWKKILKDSEEKLITKTLMLDN